MGDDIERDPDGCYRVDGRDCVARSEPCPPPGWCPATTEIFERQAHAMGTGKTAALAWNLALLIEEPGEEDPCSFEPRRRGTCL